MLELSFVTLLISSPLLDTCNSLASYAAASIPKAISWAFANVNSFSESSRFCIAFQRITRRQAYHAELDPNNL